MSDDPRRQRQRDGVGERWPARSPLHCAGSGPGGADHHVWRGEVNANYAGVIEDFRRLEVLVIGEAMLDVYLEGSAGRICREAPVPIVDVASRVNAAGGAANTALNIAALGARASLLSVTGDDPEHELIRVGLERHGVDTDHVLAISERRTLAKHRVVADSQLLVR